LSGKCSKHGRNENYLQKFGRKKVETEDLGVEGRIILKFILTKWNRTV